MKCYCFIFLLSYHLGFSQHEKPKVLILGVTHSAQLINEYQQPAVIRAFLYNIKYEINQKTISHDKAIQQYKLLIQETGKKINFKWTGVKAFNRLDSYFDPFGNMKVWQRINLELAREYFMVNDMDNYLKQKKIVEGQFSGLKKAMLVDYWAQYIE